MHTHVDLKCKGIVVNTNLCLIHGKQAVKVHKGKERLVERVAPKRHRCFADSQGITTETIYHICSVAEC